MPQRDIVVIGASAGGLPAITQLVRALPGDLPASLFIAMHLRPESNSHLPTILGRAGQLEAIFPRYREPIRRRYIYIAPPNWHMVFEEHMVRLKDGPRENGVRPAIDPLFSSAAREYGSRVVGIILSGSLDDGTAGLGAIKAHGGIAIVQEPAEAEFDGMPRSAIENVSVDYILPVAQMATRLIELIGKEDDTLELLGETENMPNGDMPQWELQFACPDCGGVLLPIKDGSFVHFRCEVGHMYSPKTLDSEQTRNAENALWAALRVLGENARLSFRLAARMRERGNEFSAHQFEERGEEAERHCENIREVLASLHQNGDYAD